MWNRLSDEEYKKRAGLLQKHFPRRYVDTRDAMVILGLRSTSATIYTMRRMVELGFLEYEPPSTVGRKHKGKFYLKEEQTDGKR